jgi:hypothetical protein
VKFLALALLPLTIWAGPARYARLGVFQGPVEVQLTAADAWMPAERNLPLPESAWIRTGSAARAEIEFDDGSVWRLGPDSQGEISDYATLSTGQHITLLSLDHGQAFFTGQARRFDSLVLAVPGAHVSLGALAHVRVEAREGSSQVWVQGGSARFSCPAAELDLTHGQTARVEPGNTSRFFLDRDNPATELDRWNAERDQALSGSVSALHVMEHSGLADLDSAGEWIATDGFGTVWKPKSADGWIPFQKGRWRWYQELGYTWVSDDPWGWLPYHYGRWAHTTDLGWFWAPNVSQVFKPGDVYWLRGAQFVGWGPLSPGEQWQPGAFDVPRQYLDLYTTYAAFATGAAAIDPLGFGGRPDDALKAGAFLSALPSPAVDAARLEATRPMVQAGSTRLAPVISGVTYQSAETPITAFVPRAPAAFTQPPVVIVETPPAEPEVVPELIPYPVPVYGGIVVGNAPPAGRSATHTAPQTAASTSTPVTRPNRPKPEKPPEPGVRRKHWQDRVEYELAEEAMRHADNPALQIQDLDTWQRRYPYSDYGNERHYYFQQAYSRMQPPQPARVMGHAASLVQQDVHTLFDDSEIGRAQVLNSLYLTTVSAQSLPGGGSPREQAIGRMAAQKLLDYLPEFFAADARPAQVSPELWHKARADMEATAKRVAAQLAARRGR